VKEEIVPTLTATPDEIDAFMTTVTTPSAQPSVNGERPVRQKRSIALCAHSQKTRDLAPITDDNWVIFGLNNLHRFVARGHLWIQIHSPEYLARHPAYSKEDIAFYESMQITLFAQKHYPQWPTSTPLPLERLRQRFPRIEWDSTMCYMVGLAVLMIEDGEFPGELGKVALPERRFGMWGLDMLDNYAQQGPNVGYLIGQAEAVGIEVVVPSGAGFFRRGYTYGFEEKAIGKRRTQLDTREAELTGLKQQVVAKSANLQNEINVINQRILALDGAIEENKYQRRNFVPEDDERAPAETFNEAQARLVQVEKIARA
jgi:hypothetical protein